MVLDILYEKAADMKIANPEMEWADIAKHIDKSERQLRRIRQTPEWCAYWDAQDKQSMIDHLRKAAVTSQNAALYKTYFEAVGVLDEDTQSSLLHLTDEQFMKELKYLHDWYERGQSDPPSGDVAT